MKGIREAALSREEPRPIKTYQSFAGTYDVDDSPHQTTLFENNYGKKNKSFSPIEDDCDEFFLSEGEFEINLIVNMSELGTSANADLDGFEFDLMLQAAQDKALLKTEKIIPNLYKNYNITTSAIENIDDITVTLRLTPIVH